MIFHREINILKRSVSSGWVKAEAISECTVQDIQVVMRFKFRTDFQVKANLRNFISYCRFLLDIKTLSL